MKLNVRLLDDSSMRQLMFGSGYRSLGQASFILVKSTYIRHMLLAFRNRTTLVSKVGYFVFVMNPTSYSFPTSSLMETPFFCNWSEGMMDGEVIAHHFGVYSWHVRESPSEQVEILNELVD